MLGRQAGDSSVDDVDGQVVLRRMPRPVLPSGELKRGADYQIAQVAVSKAAALIRFRQDIAMR